MCGCPGEGLLEPPAFTRAVGISHNVSREGRALVNVLKEILL